MDFQLSLFDEPASPLDIADVKDTIFTITWNIANPSLERAKDQWAWVSGLGANVIILSEVKASQGCSYLQHQFEKAGYAVFNETTSDNKYGVMVAVYGFECNKINLGLDYLKSRVAGIEINTFLGKIAIVGLYVPSRGNKEMRNVEKSNFQNQISTYLKNNKSDQIIIGGDLNVVPRNHEPHYPVFGEWEYTFYEDFEKACLMDVFTFKNRDKADHTWFSKDGNGFRFDFLFVSDLLTKNLSYAEHLHDARTLRLSDHSAVAMKLNAADSSFKL